MGPHLNPATPTKQPVPKRNGRKIESAGFVVHRVSRNLPPFDGFGAAVVTVPPMVLKGWWHAHAVGTSNGIEMLIFYVPGIGLVCPRGACARHRQTACRPVLTDRQADSLAKNGDHRRVIDHAVQVNK
jgi:hypothetical protein